MPRNSAPASDPPPPMPADADPVPSEAQPVAGGHDGEGEPVQGKGTEDSQ